MKKIKIGIVGTEQLSFLGDKQKNYKRATDKLNGLSKKFDFDLYTYNKLITTVQDTEAFLLEFNKQNVDLLMVTFASFASGEIITKLASAAPYIGLWALDEPNSEGILEFNSFCSLNMYASNLKNYLPNTASKHKWFFGTEEMFEKRLQITVCALETIKNMKGTKVGLIGGIVPGFNDLYYDERTVRDKLGIEVFRNNEMDDIINLSNSYSENDLKEEYEIVKSGYASIDEKIKGNMRLNAAFYKAYMQWAKEREYEAVAIACWPKIQVKFDFLTCSTIGKLNENGLPSACEGDLIGAVSMLMLKYASKNTAMLMDLVAFDSKDESIQMWHCGPAANCFANKKGCCLERFYEGQGRRNGMHNMTFKGGEATSVRITGNSDRMFILSGNFNPDKAGYYGSAGWMGDLKIAGKSVKSIDVVETVLSGGVPHHFAIAYGNLNEVMLEICSWLDLKVEQPILYANNLINNKFQE